MIIKAFLLSPSQREEGIKLSKAIWIPKSQVLSREYGPGKVWEFQEVSFEVSKWWLSKNRHKISFFETGRPASPTSA